MTAIPPHHSPHRRVNAEPLLPEWLRRLVAQVVFITPIFWLSEQLQNSLYKLFHHEFGWVYPLDQLYGLNGIAIDASKPLWIWSSLRSLPAWAGSVVVFSLLDHALARKHVRLRWRTLILGLIGWALEWTTGYIATVSHHTLQVWLNAPLVFVGISALPFWCLNFLLFHYLTRYIRVAHDHQRPAANDP
jgi:hypothetical protein